MNLPCTFDGEPAIFKGVDPKKSMWIVKTKEGTKFLNHLTMVEFKEEKDPDLFTEKL